MSSALRVGLFVAAAFLFLLIFPSYSLAVPTCPDTNTCDDQSGAPNGNSCQPIGENNSYNECCGTGLSRKVVRSRASDGVCAYSKGDCNQQDSACNNYGGGSGGGSNTCQSGTVALSSGNGCKQQTGSAVAYCFDGYQANSDNTDCVSSNCTKTSHKLDDGYGCANNSGGGIAYCFLNYTPNSDGTDCVASSSSTGGTGGSGGTGGATCDPSNPNGCVLDSTNFKAPQNADYSTQMTLHSLLCSLTKMDDGVAPCVGLVPNGNGSATAYLFDSKTPGGAIGALTNTMTAMIDNPPASTGLYLADIGQEVGLVSPAYAQVTGSGASIIDPIKSIWEITRNLAYLGFIVVFLVVGFMIMFRQKINPQTIISVQAALPSLVLGIILVTFSYFIASVIIDTAFVGIQVVANIFELVGDNGLTHSNVLDIPALAQSSNIFNLFVSSFQIPQTTKQIFTGTVSTVGSATYGQGLAVPAVIGGLVGGILLLTPAAPLGAAALGAAAPAAAPLLAGIGLSLIVPLILIIALFIQFFRLLIKLIMAYVTLIVTTVTGPLVILISSIPGRGKGIENWWKTLLANSLIFPAVFGAFLFAGLILGTDPNSWNAAPPLFGGLSTELLRLIIAYGIILATPGIPDMVKSAFGVKDIPLGSAAIGGALAGFAVAKGATTKGWKIAAGPLDKQREMRLNEYAKFQAGLPSKAGPVTAYPGWAGRFRSWYTNRGLPRDARNPFGRR